MARTTSNYNLKTFGKDDAILGTIEGLSENMEILDEQIPNEIHNATQTTLSEAKRYTDEEIATFDFIKVVSTLPATGLLNRIYFVPKADSETQDLFDEYIWVNGAWEYVGTKTMEIDIVGVIKNATNSPIENKFAWTGSETEFNALTELVDGTVYFIYK